MWKQSLPMVLAGLLSAFASPTQAWAQDDDDARIEQAQDEVMKGRALLREGKYLDGIIAYEAAYRLFPQADHLFVIARAYEKIEGRCADALLAWDRFLTECTNCGRRAEGIKSQMTIKTSCGTAADASPQPVAPSSSATGSSKKSRILSWTAIGLGAAATGVGAFFHSQAATTVDDAAGVGNRQRFDELTDDYNSQVTGLTVSYVLGGLLLTTGVTLLFFKADNGPKVSVGPSQLSGAWTF